MSPRSAGIDTLLEVDTVVQYSCSNLVLILCNGIKLFGGKKNPSSGWIIKSLFQI